MSGSDKIKSTFLVNKAKENPFVSGGLRNYREYRDFGIADMTEGKVHIHMIRQQLRVPRAAADCIIMILSFRWSIV